MNRSSSLLSSSLRNSSDDESGNNNNNFAVVLAELQKTLRSDHKMGDFASSILRNVVVRSYKNRPQHHQQKDDDDDVGNRNPSSQLVLSFLVTPELCNGFNTLHGGASATAVDVFTSILLHLESNAPSVTADLHVSCIAPAPLGSTVICICQTNKAGRGLQFASCDIYKEEEVQEERTIMTQQRNINNTNTNNKRIRRILVTKGLHTKYVLKNNQQRENGFNGSSSRSGNGSGNDGDSSGNKPLFQHQRQQHRRSKL